MARTAFLIGLATLLRQSNLLPPSPGTLHERSLRRGDVANEGGVLWLMIISSKTIAARTGRVSIPVPYTGLKYCPVLAWRQYMTHLPLPSSAPAFMLTPTKPLTPERLAFPLTSKVTVHSLRRSGAQECAKIGTPEAHLTNGTWSRNYLYIRSQETLHVYTSFHTPTSCPLTVLCIV